MQEKAARSFLAGDKATGAGSFLDVLKKITESKDQTSLYYSGGLRFLCSMCDDGLVIIVFFSHVLKLIFNADEFFV